MLTVAVAGALIALPPAEESERLLPTVRHGLTIILIASAIWLVIALTGVAQDLILARLDVSVSDNRRVRRLRTQLIMLRRLAMTVIVFIGICAALLTFPQVQALGTSLLASAGVLGIVVGLAAQATLTNVIAGLQIAFTDPIRIDDVVVVNDEWGRIEEITLTYVVVRTWDNRSLILPVQWFTANVFQNWTRHEARVIGAVILHVDYSVPVSELRTAMHGFVQESPLWDGRDWMLEVFDTTETTVVLRGLMSSADAPSNWDLRCEIREKLVGFLREHYPQSLPRTRIELPVTEQPG